MISVANVCSEWPAYLGLVERSEGIFRDVGDSVVRTLDCMLILIAFQTGYLCRRNRYEIASIDTHRSWGACTIESESRPWNEWRRY